jgi:hypothetical protein
MNEKRTGKCLRQIINGEIKQTQLGITCIASIQYHTQYISIYSLFSFHGTVIQNMMLFPFPGSTLDLNTDFRFLSIIFMHFGRRVCSRKEKIGYKSNHNLNVTHL